MDKSNTAATSEIERLTAELSDRNVECVTLKEEAESTLESKAAEINEMTVKLKENEQRYQVRISLNYIHYITYISLF